MEAGIASYTWTLKEVVGHMGRLDFWPTFKGTFAAHEWAIYPLFLLLVAIFFLLPPGVSLPVIALADEARPPVLPISWR